MPRLKDLKASQPPPPVEDPTLPTKTAPETPPAPPAETAPETPPTPPAEPAPPVEPAPPAETAPEPAPEPEPALPPFRTIVTDTDLSDDQWASLLPPTAEPRPDVVTDSVAQPPVLTAQTIAELNAGRSHNSDAASEVMVGAQASVAARLHAEQEAGRAAIMRKQGEYAQAKELTARLNAQKLREGRADASDMGYSEPRK